MLLWLDYGSLTRLTWRHLKKTILIGENERKVEQEKL